MLWCGYKIICTMRMLVVSNEQMTCGIVHHAADHIQCTREGPITMTIFSIPQQPPISFYLCGLDGEPGLQQTPPAVLFPSPLLHRDKLEEEHQWDRWGGNWCGPYSMVQLCGVRWGGCNTLLNKILCLSHNMLSGKLSRASIY